MPALLCHLRDKYGDIIKLKTGMTSMVYIFHPDYAKTVFQAPYKEHAKTDNNRNEITSFYLDDRNVWLTRRTSMIL
jgi:hypothetical protein